MSVLKGLSTSFAAALGLGMTACGPLIPENSSYRLQQPWTAPANGVMSSDETACNYGLLGPKLAVSAAHCGRPAAMRFTVFTPNGRNTTASLRYFMPSADWTKNRDVLAPQKIRNSAAYNYFARDKAIFELYTAHDKNIPFMEIAPLSALTWRPTADPMVQVADVKMRSHVTDDRFSDRERTVERPKKFYELSCHAYRRENIKEIIAHDCPTFNGMSGSILYTETPEGRQLAVAVVAGWIPFLWPGGGPLRDAFQGVTKMSNIHIASTLESFVGADLNGPDFEKVEKKRTPGGSTLIFDVGK